MSDTIIASETQIVPIDSLKPYDKNPRIGDVNAIADSLEENRQYRPIVVQTSTSKILAGNHTWMAAKKLGWESIAVVFVDVDDVRAKKIILSDNRTNDLAGYDAKMLTEILDSLPDVVGTGYSQSDLDVLLDQMEKTTDDSEELIDNIIRPHVIKSQTKEEVETDELEDAASSGGSVGGVNRPNFADDKDVKGVKVDDEELLELRALLESYEGEIWPSKSDFGIPMLSRQSLMEEIPDDLDTWVGASRHTAEEIKDKTKWWLYNYSVGTRDVPYERVILSFYVHDEKFENWWHLPAYYSARFFSAGVRNIITPDYSMWTDWPKALSVYNVYRQYWLGRFFQQADFKVCPNLCFSDPSSYDYAWDGIPQSPPMVSVQLQTIKKDRAQEWDYAARGLKTGLERVKPGALIVYTGDPGRELVESVMKTSQVRPEIVYVDSYAKKLTDQGVFERDRPIGTKRSMTGQKPDSKEGDESEDGG